MMSREVSTDVVGFGRRGMTLVELLVVTGLMAVFLSLVVVGVRGSRQKQKREAESLAAVLSAAQARALGVPEGAAVIIASGTGTTPNAAATCTTVYDAVMLPLIEATCLLGQLSRPEQPVAAVTVTPTNGEDIQRAYKILLSGRGETRIAPPAAWFAFAPPSTVSFRSDVGQTTSNTVWPKAIVGIEVTGVLAQYPIKSSAVIDFDEEIAVDLRFSGVGDYPPPNDAYGQFDGKGAIAVVFDSVGRVSDIILQVPEPGAAPSANASQPKVPVSPIYFLIGPRSVIESGGNTLASEDALWVALSPQTGRIFVADNVPQMAMDSSAIAAARQKARAGVGVGK